MGYTQPFAALRRVSLWFASLTLIMSVAACGGGGSSGGGGGSETRSIVGAWTLTIASCTDTYTFGADESFQSTSAAEIITGNYSFEKTVDSGDPHGLVINMLTDNGGTDCSGDNSNSTGVISVNTRFHGNEMDIYSGGTLIFTLTKSP